MDRKLEQDLFHFCRVYQNNVEEELKENFPANIADSVLEKLNKEFVLFEASLFNRLRQDLG